MNYCQIDNGVVVNCAVFDESMPDDWPDKDSWVQDDEAQIGWLYADGIFSAPPSNLEPLPPPPPSIETVVLYDHERRIRATEGQPPLTLGDFIAQAHGA